jgi:hypothetical protein
MALPGLAECRRGAPVDLRLGQVPDHLQAPLACGKLFQAEPGRLLLQVPGVANFLAEEGLRITVDPAPGAASADLRSWLLGPVVAALLQQRGNLVLHGSVVRAAGSAALVLGASGVGKSTLALGLAAQGRRVLSCDLCVLDDQGLVAPGPPFLRVWDDTLSQLGMDPEGLPLARTDRPKRLVPLGARYLPRSLPAGFLLLLETAPIQEPRLEPLPSSGERLRLLLEHSYRRPYLRGLGLLPQHMRQCQDLGARLPAFRLSRPEGCTPTEFAAWLDRHLDGLPAPSG